MAHPNDPPGKAPPPHIPPHHQQQLPPKKKSYLLAKIATFAILAAGGLGYYSWYVRGEREAVASAKVVVEKDLVASTTAAALCKEDLEKLKTKSEQLGGEVTKTSIEKERERSEKEQAKAAQESTEKSLTEKETEIKATRAELEELRKQRAETEKRLAAFKLLTEKFQKMVDNGKLEVMVRNGRMIVKLPASVLFGSGEHELSKEGEMAIMEVAIILKQIPDRNFVVAGHTDNFKPGKDSLYKDNWELSAARAVQVTKFLVNAGMKPAALSAAGYGEWDPVASNKSDKGRQANRRIEIVLLPNLEELPTLTETATKP